MKLQISSLKKPFVSAVICAGGNGTRMLATQTKQMIEIDHVPVIIHTLKAFCACKEIDEIILVSKEDEKEIYPSMLRKFGITKVKKIVSGGATRQESVMNGFCGISMQSDYVAIHDGARCLITPEQITKVLTAAKQYRCAAAGCMAKDTLKRATPSGFVAETVDRDEIWQVSTPQIFKTEVYRACAYTAKEKKIHATDDCMLAEAFGFRIKLVDVGYANLKITTPEDLIFANAILRQRRKKEEEQ